ncbi:hypothetical protein HMI54_008520 [Coelomomyces lativittatus]|nr:hypothetical protein HMI54_008520 [Coelomomyces lativittatus]
MTLTCAMIMKTMLLRVTRWTGISQKNRLRVFKFYPEVYWYFLFNFDVEGYGRIVFNTSFSPTGDFLRMHLERPVYKSLVQL